MKSNKIKKTTLKIKIFKKYDFYYYLISDIYYKKLLIFILECYINLIFIYKLTIDNKIV
jgi:hypothetical protein